MPDDVRINVTSSFTSEGADESTRSTRELREEFSGLASAVERADTALRERFSGSLEQLNNLPAGGALESVGRFQGPLFVDVAQQAIAAGDFTAARTALMQGYRENEPTALLQRTQADLLQARRAQGPTEAPEDLTLAVGPPAGGRLATRLQRRVEDAIPSVIANIAGGRTGVAGRSLDVAESYLEQLRALEGNTETIKALGEILEKHRETIKETTEAGGGVMGGGGGGTPVDMEGLKEALKDVLLTRGLGGAGQVGGLIGRFGALAGPWGLAAIGLAAATGGVLAITRGLERGGNAAREEALGFLDLGRQFGTERPLIYDFVGRNFRTRQALAELQFTTQDAGAFAAAYGMPTPIFRPTAGNHPEASGNAPNQEDIYGDTLAGLRLARVTGTTPDEVARLMRLGTQTGSLDGGGAERFAAIIFRAVRDGTRDGVSTSETMQAMERYFTGLQGRGVTADQREIAGYTQLLAAVRGGGGSGRSLMGLSGEQAVQGILEGLTGLGNPGLEMLSLQGVGVGTEGGMPSAEELGLTGGLARQYQELQAASPVLAGRFLLERARAGDPTLTRRLGEVYRKAFGGRADLETIFGTQALGLSYEQVLDLRASTGGSIYDFLQSPEGAIGGRLGAPTPTDVQAPTEQYFGGSIGYQKQRLDFLNEEKARLGSVAAATQQWIERIKDIEVAIGGFAARAAGIDAKRHPDEYIQRLIEGGELTPDYLEDIIKPPVTLPGVGVGSVGTGGLFFGGSGASGAAVRLGDLAARTRTYVRPDAEESGNPKLAEDLAAAIMEQESAGSGGYDAFNPDSGAFGAYQILPSNIEGKGVGWDYQYLQQDYTVEELRNRPDLQDTIAKSVLRDYLTQLPKGLNTEEAVRRIAAAWYAGPGALQIPSADQSKKRLGPGGKYPSVFEYGGDVFEIFQRIIQEQGFPGGGGAAPTPELNIVVRFEGEGGIHVSGVTGVSASRLEHLMGDAVREWARGTLSPHNQPSKRG